MSETTNIIDPTNSVESLASGDVLIISATQTQDYANTSMVTLEWAEKMPSSITSRRKVTAIQLLNTSNDKFSSGAQRCWESYTSADLKTFLGIDTSSQNDAWYIASSKNGDSVTIMDLNILNPVTMLGDIECAWKMEINETIEPDKYQKDNPEATCKRAGKDGAEITHEGQLMWRNTEMILVDPSDEESFVEHTYLVPDARKVTADQLQEQELDFEEVSMVSEEVAEVVG
jgi:hypothetical protein